MDVTAAITFFNTIPVKIVPALLMAGLRGTLGITTGAIRTARRVNDEDE
jgi:hypothetical protein